MFIFFLQPIPIEFIFNVFFNYFRFAFLSTTFIFINVCVSMTVLMTISMSDDWGILN